MTIAKAGFGGGCHWCTEGVFQSLRGVTQVDQGFVQSDAPADTWAEGVIVTFDSTVIQLETLSEVHLRTHSATRARSPRGKYRSAIYLFDDHQRLEAERAISSFAEQSGKPVHTLVIPFQELQGVGRAFPKLLSNRSEQTFLPPLHRSQAGSHPTTLFGAGTPWSDRGAGH